MSTLDIVFSDVVTNQWLPTEGRPSSAAAIAVVVDPSVAANRSVSLLRVRGGASIVTVSPTQAAALSLDGVEGIDDAELAVRLERAGVTLNTPDHLFYLPLAEQSALQSQTNGAETRQLTSDDAAAFASFTDVAPEDDLDEAFVELDHWLVFGTFVGDDLVSAASMYPWGETGFADMGVITLPTFRGRGLGRATVRAISRAALVAGYEPQYRCQLDNEASVALAHRAGFLPFGQWECIVTDD